MNERTNLKISVAFAAASLAALVYVGAGLFNEKEVLVPGALTRVQIQQQTEAAFVAVDRLPLTSRVPTSLQDWEDRNGKCSIAYNSGFGVAIDHVGGYRLTYLFYGAVSVRCSNLDAAYRSATREFPEYDIERFEKRAGAFIAEHKEASKKGIGRAADLGYGISSISVSGP